ncbi:MAG TPA: DoxX family protein [Elusimicrobia bacterium]|nr:MAG: DoxX family protein [Elusimicrobia bacterium GWA2_66_18]OGR90640.1 MAG: DoxX family protein [Elusimicrobia bacterium RBG_16_66_12]HAZ07353.1 DoxX family protein [Elusimicrobiota bacterium]
MRIEKALILIRLSVGSIFLSEGIQKFLFPEALGVGRFIKIGIPAPEQLAPFVGAVEIVCGALLLLGLFSRLAVMPLLAVIGTALVTTKVPMLLKDGFWKAAHESRTDWSMLLSLLFLLVAGAGPWSFDARRSRRDG